MHLLLLHLPHYPKLLRHLYLHDIQDLLVRNQGLFHKSSVRLLLSNGCYMLLQYLEYDMDIFGWLDLYSLMRTNFAFSRLWVLSLRLKNIGRTQNSWQIGYFLLRRMLKQHTALRIWQNILHLNQQYDLPMNHYK